MKRRRFVAGAAGLAGVGGLVVGSGAFTSVSADRDISIGVAGDNTALLRLTPVVHKIAAADPATVHQNDQGLLEIDVTEGGAAGVNNQAITWIGTSDWNDQSAWIDIDDDPINWINQHTFTPLAAFALENRGTQGYELTFEYTLDNDPGDSEMWFHFYDGTAPSFGGTNPFDYGSLETHTPSDQLHIPHDGGNEDFDLGKRIFCSIEIDTSNGDVGDDLSGTLTITAETPD